MKENPMHHDELETPVQIISTTNDNEFLRMEGTVIQKDNQGFPLKKMKFTLNEGKMQHRIIN